MPAKLLGILSILLILLAAATLLLSLRNSFLTRQLTQQTSFLTAAQGSTRFYQNKLGQETAAKQAMETEVEVLTENYRLLSANQKRLADNIQALPKKESKKLVTAIQVEQQVVIRELVHVDTSRVWQQQSDTLTYCIRTTGDTLRIDSLLLPNHLLLTQFKAKDGSIQVTATNSNPLLRTKELDSIVIPGSKPSKLVKVLLLVGGVVLGGWLF